jgi:hypothetical protein
VWVASLSTAIGAARGDDPDRRGLTEHGPHLHGAGVGAQQHALTRLLRVEEEGVVHLAGRVLLGEVQGREVVEVVLDVRALGHGEAHLGEDGDHLVHGLHGRMDAAATAMRGGQGQVQRLAGQARVEGGGFQRGLLVVQRRLHAIAQDVDRRAALLALVGAHGPQRLEQARDRAGLAQGGDAHGVEGGEIAGGGHLGQHVGFESGEIGHDGVPSRGFGAGVEPIVGALVASASHYLRHPRGTCSEDPSFSRADLGQLEASTKLTQGSSVTMSEDDGPRGGTGEKRAEQQKAPRFAPEGFSDRDRDEPDRRP